MSADLTDLMKDFLLEGFPNPERKGCPPETTIQALAEEKLAAKDPAGLHVGSCSECYDEYTQYRKDWEDLQAAASLRSSGSVRAALQVMIAKSWPRRELRIALMAAAGALCLATGITIARLWYTARAGSQNSTVSAVTLDLTDYGTSRGPGSDSSLQYSPLALPASRLDLTLILPRFSVSGTYSVSIGAERHGGGRILMSARSTASSQGDQVVLRIPLDLSGIRPGSYFLSTEQDGASSAYYYPVRID